MLFLRGEAGIGKTTFLSKAIQDLRTTWNIFYYMLNEWSTPRSILNNLSIYLQSEDNPDLRSYVQNRADFRLDEAGIRWRVIVVSACYSGGFIPPLRDPHTLVITAAAADLQSFGCGAGSEFTAFGDAYFRKALPEKRDFVAAFHRAAELLEEQEEREGRDPSKPQIFVGEAMRAKLAEWSDGQPQEEQTAMQMQTGATGHVLN